MIRFIHASDAHIDSPLRGLDIYDGAPVDLLRGATRKAFINLIQLSIDENIDFLVMSGDLYDGDWKDYSTGLFIRAQLVRLHDRGIPVYMIAGNHDAESVITKTLSLPKNVHVFSTRTTESIEVPGHPVVIHGRGFPKRAVPENLVLEYPAAVANKFNIGLLHTSLTGRTGHGTYAPCNENDLRQKGYSYWALGHIHKPEVVSEDPWIVFSGNSQVRNVGEVGPRGCRLVSVNDTLEVEGIEWHDLDVVRWHILEVDLVGITEEGDAFAHVSSSMAKAIAESDGRLIAARLVFKGATSLHGSLHRETERWSAELHARAQDQGSDALWIEKIKLSTTPLYNVQELAEQDALTKIVIETLGEDTLVPEILPSIKDMLDVLPPEIRSEVESELHEDAGVTLMEDVRAIILDSLTTKGGAA